jgi:hypothetical protein
MRGKMEMEMYGRLYINQIGGLNEWMGAAIEGRELVKAST